MASVYVVILNPEGVVRVDWAMAWGNKNWPMACPATVAVKAGYRNLDHARNQAVGEAIAAGLDLLFFWDDDVIPRNVNDAGRMVQTMAQPENENITALGGIYPRRVKGVLSEPIVTRKPSGGVWWKPVRDKGFYRCHMTGTGFTVFRVKQLAEMDVPTYTHQGKEYRQYFACMAGYPIRNPVGTLMTDDFQFAQTCAEHGKEWWVDGSIVCDQIDLNGTRYRVEDAIPKKAR